METPANGLPVPPVDYITVTAGGSTYQLKASLLTEYVLDNMGVDVAKILPTLASNEPGRVALIMKLFAALVAHHFVARNETVPTADHWAAVIKREEWPSICAAVFQTLVKPKPPQANPETAAAQVPPPTAPVQ